MAQSDVTEKERNILRIFFDTIDAMAPHENTISDSKLVKNAKNKLKNILRGSEHRCTCAKRTWGGICELCQVSDNELVILRNFYIQMCRAKKCNLSAVEIHEFIENTKKNLTAKKMAVEQE
jgi:hypothetical protein